MALLKQIRNHSSALEETTMNDVWDKAKAASMTVWGRTTRRMRLAGAVLIFL